MNTVVCVCVLGEGLGQRKQTSPRYFYIAVASISLPQNHLIQTLGLFSLKNQNWRDMTK